MSSPSLQPRTIDNKTYPRRVRLETCNTPISIPNYWVYSDTAIITGMPKPVDLSHIREHFSEMGSIATVRMHPNRKEEDGESVLVQFDNAESATTLCRSVYEWQRTGTVTYSARKLSIKETEFSRTSNVLLVKEDNDSNEGISSSGRGPLGGSKDSRKRVSEPLNVSVSSGRLRSPTQSRKHTSSPAWRSPLPAHSQQSGLRSQTSSKQSQPYSSRNSIGPPPRYRSREHSQSGRNSCRSTSLDILHATTVLLYIARRIPIIRPHMRLGIIRGIKQNSKFNQAGGEEDHVQIRARARTHSPLLRSTHGSKRVERSERGAAEDRGENESQRGARRGGMRSKGKMTDSSERKKDKQCRDRVVKAEDAKPKIEEDPALRRATAELQSSPSDLDIHDTLDSGPEIADIPSSIVVVVNAVKSEHINDDIADPSAVSTCGPPADLRQPSTAPVVHSAFTPAIAQDMLDLNPSQTLFQLPPLDRFKSWLRPAISISSIQPPYPAFVAVDHALHLAERREQLKHVEDGGGVVFAIADLTDGQQRNLGLKEVKVWVWDVEAGTRDIWKANGKCIALPAME